MKDKHIKKPSTNMCPLFKSWQNGLANSCKSTQVQSALCLATDFHGLAFASIDSTEMSLHLDTVDIYSFLIIYTI